MIEITMQVSDFDYSETLERFLPEIMMLMIELPLFLPKILVRPSSA